MKVFFDTEFTGLHKGTTLISIGLVSEDNKTFYAEFTDYDISQIDDWIENNVIKNLKYHGSILPLTNSASNTDSWFDVDINGNVECIGSKKSIKTYLTDWLDRLNDNIELVSDCCHYDMVLFIDIFGGAFDIPKQVCPVCYDINQDIARYFHTTQTTAFDLSREEIVNSLVDDLYDLEIGQKHNALFDANVIKKIYELINGV